MLAGEKTPTQLVLVQVFAVVPLLAVAAAVPVAWGWGLGWVDIDLALLFYTLTCLGVTIGFHRYFTHGAFSMAMQGPVVGWVADHRRHHAYADKEGDPHSPWLFGTSATALAKGFWHAHMGWMFQRERTNAQRFAPDLLADNDIQRIDRDPTGSPANSNRPGRPPAARQQTVHPRTGSDPSCPNAVACTPRLTRSRHRHRRR